MSTMRRVFFVLSITLTLLGVSSGLAPLVGAQDGLSGYVCTDADGNQVVIDANDWTGSCPDANGDDSTNGAANTGDDNADDDADTTWTEYDPEAEAEQVFTTDLALKLCVGCNADQFGPLKESNGYVNPVGIHFNGGGRCFDFLVPHGIQGDFAFRGDGGNTSFYGEDNMVLRHVCTASIRLIDDPADINWPDDDDKESVARDEEDSSDATPAANAADADNSDDDANNNGCKATDKLDEITTLVDPEEVSTWTLVDDDTGYQGQTTVELTAIPAHWAVNSADRDGTVRTGALDPSIPAGTIITVYPCDH